MALAHGEGPYIAAGVGLLLISSAVSLSVPMGMGHIIDTVVTAGSAADPDAMAASLTRTCLGLGAFFVVGAGANAGRIFLIQRSGQRIVARLREKLFTHLAHQDMAFFDTVKTGELVNRLSSDTVVVGKALADNISDGLRSAGQGLVGVSLMVYLCPKLAGTFLLVIPPIGIMAAIYGRTIKKLSQQTQTALAEASARADETFANIYSVRANAQESGMAHEYSSKVQTAYQISKKEILARAGFFGFAALAGNLSMVAVLGYGGTLTAANALSIGDLSAFLLYTAYAGMSISGLASFQAELMKGIGASTRLFGLLEQQPTVTGTGTIPDHEFNGHVEFRNVDFKYATRESTVITGLNLAVPAGTTHAVVGGSGSGKSTLFALLLRLYETDAGGVYIDGHNVKDLDPKWLREQIGTVEQNPVLFSGTVADNIRFGVAEASPDEIEAVARQAFAHEFIESFPDGYDTIVGERGVMLSGGQQQRIAIARAILKDPKILLLDEATSSLDTESEQYVQAALQRLMVGRTTLQIAHRLSTISGSHGVAVISDGAVAENGTYAELIGRKGAFYDLMRRQNLAT